MLCLFAVRFSSRNGLKTPFAWCNGARKTLNSVVSRTALVSSCGSVLSRSRPPFSTKIEMLFDRVAPTSIHTEGDRCTREVEGREVHQVTYGPSRRQVEKKTSRNRNALNSSPPACRKSRTSPQKTAVETSEIQTRRMKLLTHTATDFAGNVYPRKPTRSPSNSSRASRSIP